MFSEGDFGNARSLSAPIPRAALSKTCPRALVCAGSRNARIPYFTCRKEEKIDKGDKKEKKKKAIFFYFVSFLHL